ncbi:MAG: phosphatidate cytidylyltransferase, partial [Spirochaetota bacterium]
FASINIGTTMGLLGMGIIFYACAEKLRIEGIQVFLISNVTCIASRERDAGKFVLGPITLGLGAMLALLFYPEPAASLAIYALAFGDSISSLAGKLLNSAIIPLTGGKTIAGSLGCFITVLVIFYRITGNVTVSIILAFTATVLEMMPSKDLDNLLIPVGTGFVAYKLLIV